MWWIWTNKQGPQSKLGRVTAAAFVIKHSSFRGIGVARISCKEGHVTEIK